VLSRRQLLMTLGGAAVGLAAPALHCQPAAADSVAAVYVGPGPRLRVGLLWSLTGHLSLIEKPSHDVALFWIDRTNRAGGVAGYQIEPYVVDARSDLQAYRNGVLKLLLHDRVLAVFGGYTSASRRAIMPLVTKHGGLLYYPTCYEGRECWQNIICTGPIANQHSFDLISFMVKRFGDKAFFVGSNYIWAWESNRNARYQLNKVGGTLLGERYIPLGHDLSLPIINEIKRKRPAWIFTTVIADSDIFFRRAYANAGLTAEEMPIASLTTSEIEIRALGEEYGHGHILCAPYFQSLTNAANRNFVDSFLSSPFGTSGVTHFNMEETYLSFLYFRNAIESIVTKYGGGRLSPAAIISESRNIGIGDDESPEGSVFLDPLNLNSWLTPRIGMFNHAGQIDVLWERPEKVSPMPYLLYPDRGICRADGLHLPSGKVVKAAS
jgi:urea transport system substrate-binding protein